MTSSGRKQPCSDPWRNIRHLGRCSSRPLYLCFCNRVFVFVSLWRERYLARCSITPMPHNVVWAVDIVQYACLHIFHQYYQQRAYRYSSQTCIPYTINSTLNAEDTTPNPKCKFTLFSQIFCGLLNISNFKFNMMICYLNIRVNCWDRAQQKVALELLKEKQQLLFTQATQPRT